MGSDIDHIHPRTEMPGPTATALLCRDELATLTQAVGGNRGWLTCSADGRLQIAMRRGEVDHARAITARCLRAAGIVEDDRVVVALNSDGAGVGVLWSGAAANVGTAATSARPNGARRLLGRLLAADASALICTPTAARQLAHTVADEPDLDPQLRRVVLVGELIDRAEAVALASMLRCLVSEVWPDPVFGVALAWRDALTAASFRRVDPALLSTVPHGDAAAEWVVHPQWCKELHGISYRSGVVSARSTPVALDRPRWTTGDQLLVRGRWLSCRSLERTLDRLGVTRWQLRISRYRMGERIELIVSHPAPRRGIESALAAVTPLRLDVRCKPLPSAAPRLVDRRGHHLTQPFSRNR